MCIMILKNDTVGLCILYTLPFLGAVLYCVIVSFDRVLESGISTIFIFVNDEGNIVSGHPVCALLAIEDTHEDC